MFDVLLVRGFEDHRATLGILSIEGVAHDPFFTLENPIRRTPKDSRIPEGMYICSPYSGTKFKDVYLVEDVPGREAILFHWGNFESDTEGCILLGESILMNDGRPMIGRSRDSFRRFRNIIGNKKFRVSIVDVPMGPVVPSKEGSA